MSIEAFMVQGLVALFITGILAIVGAKTHNKLMVAEARVRELEAVLASRPSYEALVQENADLERRLALEKTKRIESNSRADRNVKDRVRHAETVAHLSRRVDFLKLALEHAGLQVDLNKIK